MKYFNSKRVRDTADMWWDGSLKGYQVSPTPNAALTEASFDFFKTHGVTVIRSGILVNGNATTPYTINEASMTFQLWKLAQARRVGIKVIVSVHINGQVATPEANGLDVWTNPVTKNTIGDIYRAIATAMEPYQDVIIAIDVNNEPTTPRTGITVPAGYQFWYDRMLYWSECIREVLPDMTLIIEPNRTSGPHTLWGNPGTPYDTYPAAILPLPNLVYSIHFYTTHNYTHQNLSDGAGGTIPFGNYPTANNNALYFERQMRDIYNWQLEHNIPVFIGEFSVVYFAELGGRLQWFRDVLSLLNKFKFSWTMHAYAEWEGWDPRYTFNNTSGARENIPNDELLNIIETALLE